VELVSGEQNTMLKAGLARAGGRVVAVDLLAVMFGLSSWISINGLWVELPMLVTQLPEYWALPSYLSIIVQVANIGPITYGLLRHCLATPPPQHASIVAVLGVGVAASLGLVLAWDLTSIIAGQQRSTGLFVSVFLLSLVDCTSSVLFLPYMASFKQTYLNSYLIGEGMSGFVPAIAALAQGVSGNPQCVNGTVVPVLDQARFPTADFFVFLMVMMVLSLTAFLLLHYLPSLRSERVTAASTSRSSSTNFSSALHEGGGGQYGSTVSSPSTSGEESEGEQSLEDTGTLATPHTQELASAGPIWPLLLVQCLVCCLSNGALPSIQSYSCLPYGNTVYHLAVTLNAMANPLMAFLAFFLPCRRRSVVLGLAATGCLLSGYILATAAHSPAMLGGAVAGGGSAVAAWVLTGALFSYVKVTVAGLCRDSGYLFSCGVVTQVGSAVGALVMFILVNKVNLFESYYPSC